MLPLALVSLLLPFIHSKWERDYGQNNMLEKMHTASCIFSPNYPILILTYSKLCLARYRDPQLQVGEDQPYVSNLKHLQILMFECTSNSPEQ